MSSGSDITEGKIKKARLPNDVVYSADARLSDARAALDPANLSVSNLNTVTATGVYYQSANVNATLARNYPVVQAGVLEVTNYSAGVFWSQRYTTYEGSGERVFVRGFYKGTIDAWSEIAKISDTAADVGATMGTPTATTANGTATSGTTETRDAILGNYQFT